MKEINLDKLKAWLLEQNSKGNWAFLAEDIAKGLKLQLPSSEIKDLELALEKVSFLSTHKKWLGAGVKDSHPGAWRFLISIPARIEWDIYEGGEKKQVWEPA